MVSNYFGSHKGGIELVAEQLFHGLADAGCEIVWAAADSSLPPHETNRGRTYPLQAWNGIERATGLPFPLPTPRALRELGRKIENSDVVVLQDCMYCSNIAAFLFACFLHKPVVCIQHISRVPYRNRVLRLLMWLADKVITRPMLSQAEQVVFISEITRRCFEGTVYKRPPELIFNGVDTDIFRPFWGDETKASLRAQMNLDQVISIALFVGRFVEKKGLGVLKHLTMLAPDILWVFAGWGPMDPANWGAPNVRIFSGLHGPSIAKLYRASDVLVLPSVGEGFPLVIQEALACGLPVVCGQQTAGADHEATPFLRAIVQNDNERCTAVEFLKAIREQLAIEADYSADSVRIRHDFAASRYSWKKAIEQYMEILSDVSQDQNSS
jgi:glycosyltransferase involved in cell wall biosynthesis